MLRREDPFRRVTDSRRRPNSRTTGRMSDFESGWKQRGFRVRGRVQGVGFRWWTRRKASDLGLRGTVRNRPDGTVEVHAAGLVETLEAFAAELEVGPLGARVEGVDDFRSGESLPTRFEII